MRLAPLAHALSAIGLPSPTPPAQLHDVSIGENSLNPSRPMRNSLKLAGVLVALAFALPCSSGAQAAPDSAAIRAAALDYIEGWYEGNTERMERALHPELAKRIVNTEHGERAHRCLDLGGLPARRQVERPLGDRECRVGAAAAIGPAGHSFEHARRTT